MAPLRGRKRKNDRRRQAGAGGGAGLLAVAGAAWLLLARRRRNRAKDAGVHPTEPRVVTGQGEGVAGGPDDTTLAHKVQSEIFRDGTVPAGAVAVNSEFGVIFLRGELDSDEKIERLVTAAREVDGVKDVRNLLHTPSAA